MSRVDYPIREVTARAYTVPTDLPESDGTLAWDATTLVLVEVEAGGCTGLGYTYSHRAAAALITEKLREVVIGQDAMGIPGCWARMVESVRNLGRPGLASTAIAAVDNALWDLKGRLLDLPLVTVLGAAREAVPVYGSGGFTSYDEHQLAAQLGGWVEAGIGQVKMKVGREPARDMARVRAARQAIGPDAQLFVDANGAYARKQALEKAAGFADLGVSWFEEPVSSDDLHGLRLIRDRAPAEVEISAGEYGYTPTYFRRMLAAGAVDVLQADATRCAGISGFLGVAALCEAFHIPLSSHTAPTLHLHAACATTTVRHMEYFHDHVRIEQLFFDGPRAPAGGLLAPDLSRPGLGIEFKARDAQPYAV